ncbi:MAG: hypothetical protein MUD06_11870 [Rhodospirillales bacterium]|jgi:hypothetical protein|nr:hypothetical protein [Rhodospirillales bacterium]
MLEDEVSTVSPTLSDRTAATETALRSRGSETGTEGLAPDDQQPERVFSECTSVLLPAVLAELPNIGQLIATRSTAFPINAEAEASNRFLFEALSVVVPLVTQVLPTVLEQIRGSSAGESTAAEGDERGIDQLLPSILANVVPQVVTALPSVLQTLFGTSGRFASPEEPGEQPRAVIIDTEVSSRFLGAILPALATGLASSLPQLISVITGTRSRGSRDMSVSWTDFQGSGRFWDNDVIIARQTPLSDPNALEIGLEIAPHLTWWKGIEVLDDNGQVITSIQVEGARKAASISLDPSLIDRVGSLLFLKAKAFGAHTGMYRLPTAGLPLRGQFTSFSWIAN